MANFWLLMQVALSPLWDVVPYLGGAFLLMSLMRVAVVFRR